MFIRFFAIWLSFATLVQAQIIVGSGSDRSYVVIEAELFGAPLVYEYRYDYVPGNPLDSFTLLTNILAADPNLDAEFNNFGTASDPNYFLNSITYNSQTLTNTPFPQVGPFWTQWVSGGEAGFPVAQPIASDAWTFGSGISAPFRTIQPGSWDGYIFNTGVDSPTVMPVPEPAVWVLFVSAIFCNLIRRKSSSHAQQRI